MTDETLWCDHDEHPGAGRDAWRFTPVERTALATLVKAAGPVAVMDVTGAPADPGRVWDAQRKAQGFRSQAHLDAFYVHVDHERACSECGQPGPAAWLEGDASWQPTSAQCATGRALFIASYSDNF